MLLVMSMKKLLRQRFSVFEPEQFVEMGNYKYSFDRNFIITCQMDLVCFIYLFIFFFVLVHPVYSKLGCATIVNREIKVSVLFHLLQS